jgi:hypothetical protein
MSVERLAVKRPRGPRPASSQGIMDRINRYRIAEKCGAVSEEVADWLITVFRNEPRKVKTLVSIDGVTQEREVIKRDYTFDEQFKCAKEILDRAIGRPQIAMVVDETKRELLAQKVVHIVKWMPPDPNDHSKRIEPEPD